MTLNLSAMGIVIMLVYLMYTVFSLKKDAVVVQQKQLKKKLKKSNKMSFAKKRRQTNHAIYKILILKMVLLYMLIAFVLTRAIIWEYPVIGAIIVVILISFFVRFVFVNSNKMNQLLLTDEDVTYREMAENAVYISHQLKIPVLISTVILCISTFLSMTI